MSPISEAQKRATEKYHKAHYERINLLVKKGQREAFRAHAEARGESLNGFITRAIRETMQRDAQSDHQPDEPV